MRAVLKQTPHECTITNDDGVPIPGIVKFQVTAEVGEPVRADISLIFVEETTIEGVKPTYHVGGHSGVVALLLANGQRVDLPEA